MEPKETQSKDPSSTTPEGHLNGNNIPEDDDLTQFEENPDPMMETEINSESTKESEPPNQIGEPNSEASEEVEDPTMEQDSEDVEIPENSEIIDSEELLEAGDAEEDSEMPNPAEEHSEEFFEDSEDDAPVKLTQLPLARIKRIMKTALGEDSSVKLINKESMFVVAQATELFIAAIAQETAKITHTNKKKTMTMQHLITTIKESENFAFLEGTMVPDYDF